MPPGVKAIAVLMGVGAVIAVTAAVTLLVPGTRLDGIWAVKEEAYRQMLPFRWLAGAGFLILSAATLCAALGLWRGRRWGWALAILILALNGVSDLGRAVTGDVAGGVFGALIAAALVAYLARAQIRMQFR